MRKLSARSGFLKVAPASSGRPSGQKIAASGGFFMMAAKLSVMTPASVGLIVKPFSASLIAGAITWSSLIVPYC